MARFCIPTIVEAETEEEAYRPVSDLLDELKGEIHPEPHCLYVGAPWEVPDEDTAEFGTAAITIWMDGRRVALEPTYVPPLGGSVGTTY